MEAAELELSSHVAEPRGTLRVSAPLSFDVLYLSPVIAAFLKSNLRVELEIDWSDRRVDLVAEGFDVALRIGVLADSSLVARKVAALGLVVCASPDYLRGRTTPASAGDHKDHDCLLYRHGQGVSWCLLVDSRVEAVPMRGTLRVNNGDVLRDAAIAGLGLTQLPRFIVQSALNDGRLVTVLDDLAPDEGAMYLVRSAHRQRSPALRAFMDHLVGALGRSTTSG